MINATREGSSGDFTSLRKIQLTATSLGLMNAVMLAGAAHAQGADAAAGSNTNAPTKLPELVVSGQADSYKPEAVDSPRFTEPLRDIPQTITVIPQSVMREQNVTTLRDVLRNVPGISIQAGEGGGGLPGDNLSIRGFSARSDIFVDGVRDYGAYSRDPFNTEQVEVYKGATSAAFGRGSVGGSVNLSTKRPTLRPFYSGSFGLGTDEYKRLTADFNQPLKELGLESSAVRLNGLWHDADMPGRDIVTNERWAVAPAVSFGIGQPTQFTVLYQHMEQDNVPEYGIPWVPANTNPALAAYSDKAPPVSFENFYGLKGYDFEHIQNDIATGILEHKFNESISLRNLSRFGRTERDSAITAPRFDAVNTSTAIRRQLQRRQIEHQVYANATDARFDFDTGPLTHALISGVEFSREEQDNRNSAQFNNQPLADLYNPNPGQLPLGPMPPINVPWTEARADTAALFVSDTLKFAEKWELLGGLRYDHIETDFTGTGGRTDDLLSYRSGLVFKPLKNGSVYFSYGTSFNPSLEGNSGIAGNILNLDPEESEIYELGTKWDLLEERLSLSAAVFHNLKSNVRTPDIANTGVTVLEGEQRVNGVEFGAAGTLTKFWRVFGAYTYLDSKVENSNNPQEESNVLGNTPDHSFSVWTTFQLPFNLELGGGAQYVGERRNNNTTAARIAPDYVVFDATLAYNVNEHFSLRLNVYNIADEQYIDRVGGGHFIPGAGRSAVLTANLTY